MSAITPCTSATDGHSLVQRKLNNFLGAKFKLFCGQNSLITEQCHYFGAKNVQTVPKGRPAAWNGRRRLKCRDVGLRSERDRSVSPDTAHWGPLFSRPPPFKENSPTCNGSRNGANTYQHHSGSPVLIRRCGFFHSSSIRLLTNTNDRKGQINKSKASFLVCSFVWIIHIILVHVNAFWRVNICIKELLKHPKTLRNHFSQWGHVEHQSVHLSSR